MGMATVYAGDYKDCSDCDMIIVTAGRNRRSGESRLNLIQDNSAIMKNVADSIRPYYTGGVILMVSNPVDILVTLCDSWTGLPNGKAFGNRLYPGQLPHDKPDFRLCGAEYGGCEGINRW